MPTINRDYDPANGFQSFVDSAPFDGTVTVTNNGAFHVYVYDVTNQPPTDAAKIIAGTTKTFRVVAGRRYDVQVMGAVSITYNITQG
jgi:hypothetical protein